MIENKLKFMLENNKLDGLINNKSEAEKLCKLGTTEEVLDLLNKYNYNETKKVFERELLEILQEINLTEEELNNVSGGKISHRQEIAKFLGVVSLAGSINMPPTMAEKKPVIAVDDTSVSAVEKKPVSAVDAASVIAVEKEKKKNSGWLSHTTEDKFAKILTGIVGTGGFIGLGTLLLYGGKKLSGLSGNEIKHEERDRSTATSAPEGMPNDQLAELSRLVAPKETWTGSLAKVNSIVVSLIKSPVKKYAGLVTDISSHDLISYATEGLKLWCTNTHKDYDQKTRSITNADTWNKNFGLLVKARWAVWLLLIKEDKVKDERLKNYVELRRFDKINSEAFAGDLAWKESAPQEVPLSTLTNPNTQSYYLDPWIGKDVGNVTYSLMSLVGDLTSESQTATIYKELLDAMVNTATGTLTNCTKFIETD